LRYGETMLSVVIEADDDAEALVRTLASLVPGAVEGAVREVIICDAAHRAVIRDIADQTGCRYVGGAAAAKGLAGARSDWLLLLEPGSRLLEGWVDSVLDHVREAEQPARFTRTRQSRLSAFMRLFSRERPLRDGLVVRRQQAVEASGTAALAPGTFARRLPAEILVAGA
jgi:hypothetical protein